VLEVGKMEKLEKLESAQKLESLGEIHGNLSLLLWSPHYHVEYYFCLLEIETVEMKQGQTEMIDEMM
jgi:hypothetical protein